MTHHGVGALDESGFPLNIGWEFRHWRDGWTEMRAFLDAVKDRMVCRLGDGRIERRVIPELHDSLALSKEVQVTGLQLTYLQTSTGPREKESDPPDSCTDG